MKDTINRTLVYTNLLGTDSVVCRALAVQHLQNLEGVEPAEIALLNYIPGIDRPPCPTPVERTMIIGSGMTHKAIEAIAAVSEHTVWIAPNLTDDFGLEGVEIVTAPTYSDACSKLLWQFLYPAVANPRILDIVVDSDVGLYRLPDSLALDCLLSSGMMPQFMLETPTEADKVTAFVDEDPHNVLSRATTQYTDCLAAYQEPPTEQMLEAWGDRCIMAPEDPVFTQFIWAACKSHAAMIGEPCHMLAPGAQWMGLSTEKKIILKFTALPKSPMQRQYSGVQFLDATTNTGPTPALILPSRFTDDRSTSKEPVAIYTGHEPKNSTRAIH